MKKIKLCKIIVSLFMLAISMNSTIHAFDCVEMENLWFIPTITLDASVLPSHIKSEVIDYNTIKFSNLNPDGKRFFTLEYNDNPQDNKKIVSRYFIAPNIYRNDEVRHGKSPKPDNIPIPTPYDFVITAFFDHEKTEIPVTITFTDNEAYDANTFYIEKAYDKYGCAIHAMSLNEIRVYDFCKNLT